MPCPEATGGCTVTPDGACIAPKTSASLPALENVFIQGAADSLTVTWDTGIAYATYSVTVLLRPTEGVAHTLWPER